jgi:hypothetical protein
MFAQGLTSTKVVTRATTQRVKSASSIGPATKAARVAAYKKILADRKIAEAKAILAYNTGTWTDAKITKALSDGCDYYKITGSDKTWIVAKGFHIIHGECGSHRTWIKNTSSSATGLLQFLKGWGTSKCVHGVPDFRKCGTCSCYRFIRAYKEGGVKTIKSAWAATYN